MNKTDSMEFLSDLFDGLGLTAFIAAIMLKLSQWILDTNLNDKLITGMTILGIVYSIYKIINVRLDNRLKKRDLKNDKS